MRTTMQTLTDYEKTKRTVIAIRRDFRNGASVSELMQKYHYAHVTIRHILHGYSGYAKFNQYEPPIKTLVTISED